MTIKNFIFRSWLRLGERTKLLSYLISSSLIYSCDFSFEMLKCIKNVFGDYYDNKDNSNEFISKIEERINVNNDIKAIKVSKKKIQIIRNSESLSFENEQFDISISSLILKITDYNQSVKEAYRVLKKGGTWRSLYGEKEVKLFAVY